MENLPVQHGLGLSWDIHTDSFTFQIEEDHKSQRRTVHNKQPVRSPKVPSSCLTSWKANTQRTNDLSGRLGLTTPWWHGDWVDQMKGVTLQLATTHDTTYLHNTCYCRCLEKRTLHFCGCFGEVDCRCGQHEGDKPWRQTEVRFVFGKTKLAPQPSITIPRLELFTAVLTLEIAELVIKEMNESIESVTYSTANKIVQGYIHNQSRRFYVFMHNWIQHIRQSSHPSQWKYV